MLHEIGVRRFVRQAATILALPKGPAAQNDFQGNNDLGHQSIKAYGP